MSPGFVHGLIAFGSLVAVMLLFEIWKQRRQMRNRPPPVLASRDEVAAMGSPSVLLTATTQPGFSKIGGAPDLAADLAWPAGENGPRVFLAQLDLAEVKGWGGPEWLPSTGRIYAFADLERGGFADLVTVLASTQAPQPPWSGNAGQRERRVEGGILTSFPSSDWLGVDGIEGDDEDDNEFPSEPEPVGREGVHRIGGYPGEIQGGRMSIECEYLARGQNDSYPDPVPPEIEEAARSWRLLLQIDSDDELKTNWWDGGRFYIFIREEDARAGDFSKTVTLSQCY